MSRRPKNVAVLGSTGSIGRNVLEVIAASEGRLQALALSAHRRMDLLVTQAQQFKPRWVVATDRQQAEKLDQSKLPDETTLCVGHDGLEQTVRQSEIDIVAAAIVGSAGLRSTWAAMEAGKTIALANKETLVMAGPLVAQLCQATGSTILPVDSEHSAVFQALKAGRRSEVRRIVLTASGGPFRRHTPQQLADVTVEEALAHPTWAMGPKITVDSATMMNKALEIIEARWLFDLAPEQIDVVVHPQSIVHSLVEFVDGSLIAQLSPPDMKLPIQFALDYPERLPGTADRLDLTETWSLDFEPIDPIRFPAIELGHEVVRIGGTAGAVLNAANEAAVAHFLAGKLRYNKIVPACRSVLEHHQFDPKPSLEDLLRLDGWARQEVAHWICI